MADIILTNISKSFGDKVLFREYSLEIERGDFVAIMGASGSGKTTLLNIMGLCGQKKLSFSSPAANKLRREKISYLFQNYGLIDTETVEGNMKIATHFKKLGKRDEQQLIANALAQVGLQGYEHRRVYTLSGGEQQRVALAKIIAKSPQIIFADEPTGSLDEKNRDYVLEILKELNHQGKTIVVVTHDPNVNACAKRHLSLSAIENTTGTFGG